MSIPIETPATTAFEQVVLRKFPDSISFTGVGDIMMGTVFPNESYLPPDSGKRLFEPVNHILNNADITFGNLEGVLFDGEGIPKKCKNPDVCYIFKSPEYYVNHLKDAGFDIMSLANNHAGDFGDPGREGTKNTLAEAGIALAGLLDTTYTIVESKGLQIGMVAFSPNFGTVSINLIEEAEALVFKVDSLCDILIISFHGGAEGKEHQHITRKNETFYGENRGNVYEFSHRMIDAGADIVFGHGPHVTRGIELYKDRFIAYSLGNFCTYARFNLRGPNGVAPILRVTTDATGRFLYGKVHPIRQTGEGGPRPDPEAKALQILRDLSAEDFPESPLHIDESGNITYIVD